MTITYKNAQVQSASASLDTYATLYKTTTASAAIISTLAITNTASVASTFRIGIMGTEGTPAAANWVVYNSTVNGSDTIFLTVGLTLSANQFIRVSSNTTSVTFSAYISEIT
jgi:hypothetical protein